MFLKYGGRNFYCFKDDFEVDLRLNKNCPNDISHGKDYSNILCIKGANAAGKTNALKAIAFMCNFITNSFSHKPDEEIGIESYFQNSDPIFLFCEFRINDTEYRYELTINNKKVLAEALVKLGGGVAATLFERELDKVNMLGGEFKDLAVIPQIRSNASLISVANQHEVKSTALIYKMFSGAIYNVNNLGFLDLTEDEVHRFYHRVPEALEFTAKLLVRFDTGIVDIKIETYEDSEGKKIYYPVFVFYVDGVRKSLRFHHQSSGTKRLYHWLAFCFLLLDNSDQLPYSLLFIADELDLHLHSKILPEITKLFEDSNNTQLIFTCQNDQILDSMGKYRTVLINKEQNESYSYRLDELPSDLLRNKRPVTPHYANGSIGGVPDIG